MKTPDHDPLLAHIFSETADAQFRAELLEKTLRAARQHQRLRQLRPILLSALLLLTLVVTLFSPRGNVTRSQPLAIQPQLPSPTAANEHVPPIRMISDDELLALFPNRAVALVGPPDHRRLIFLE